MNRATWDPGYDDRDDYTNTPTDAATAAEQHSLGDPGPGDHLDVFVRNAVERDNLRRLNSALTARLRTAEDALTRVRRLCSTGDLLAPDAILDAITGSPHG